MKKLLLIVTIIASIQLQAQKMAKHTVQRHDNLFRISLQYNSTADDIIKANPHINPQKLKTGTVLIVPKDTKIRDAAFVASLLDEKPLPTPAVRAKATKSKKSSFKTDISAKAAIKPDNIMAPHPATEAVSDADDRPSSSTAQSFTSEGIQRRYEELKKIERQDNNVTIVDMNKINVNQVTGPDYAGSARQLSDAINSDRVIIVNLQIVLKDGTVKTYSDPEDQKRVLSQIAADLPVK
jgi:LysM repeat protein